MSWGRAVPSIGGRSRQPGPRLGPCRKTLRPRGPAVYGHGGAAIKDVYIGGVHIHHGLLIASIGVTIHVAYTIACLLKGKLATGVIGFPIPLVALVGAVRLAKPGSYWARRFYREAKMESAQERFGSRHQARRERLRDLFSGGS